MNDTSYFSHNYNTRMDKKIKRLIIKHGMLGYGLFWAIIEDLYINTNVLQTDYECISLDFRVDEKIVKSVINDFDLFQIKDGFFSSESVQRRLDLKSEKSLKAKESISYRWDKNSDEIRTNNERNTDELQTKYDSNTKRNKEINKNISLYKNKKSPPLPLGGKERDFFEKRAKWYSNHAEKNKEHKIYPLFKQFVGYLCSNMSPLLTLKSLTIYDFLKLSGKISRHEVSIIDVMPKFDKNFEEFKYCKDANEALFQFIEKYYPKES